jgi:hypothetical protein
MTSPERRRRPGTPPEEGVLHHEDVGVGDVAGLGKQRQQGAHHPGLIAGQQRLTVLAHGYRQDMRGGEFRPANPAALPRHLDRLFR